MKSAKVYGVPLLLLVLGGCCAMGGGGGTAVPRARTLYQRLGGKAAIVAVVEDFVGRVAADKRINQQFANTDLKNLKKQLVDQICQAAGGPCKYKGGSMKAVHEGLGISDADFDALVGDLVAALDRFKVEKQEQDELLSVLGPMRKDIVEK